MERLAIQGRIEDSLGRHHNPLALEKDHPVTRRIQLGLSRPTVAVGLVAIAAVNATVVAQ